MIEARGARDDPPGRDADDVLAKEPDGALSPARAHGRLHGRDGNFRRSGRRSRVDQLIARPARFAPVNACDERLARACGARPLRRSAQLLRRNALDTSQSFAVPVGGYGEEVLVEDFRPSVSAR